MFKIQDLMIDVLTARGGGGDVGMPTPTEPSPPPTNSPVAMSAAIERKFAVVDQAVRAGEKVNVRLLEDAALQVGRALVGARIAGYCTQDMATCDNNERISPWATVGIGELLEADFAVIKRQVEAASEWVNERGDLLEKRAVQNKRDLVPRLEGALEYLKSS